MAEFKFTTRTLSSKLLSTGDLDLLASGRICIHATGTARKKAGDWRGKIECTEATCIDNEGKKEIGLIVKILYKR
jgi:hypothetical protein